MKSVEKRIEECMKLSSEVTENPSSRNLSKLNKTIKEAKAVLENREEQIKLKREISRMEMKYRKQRTHRLIQIGAEYCRVFENDSLDDAKELFESIKNGQYKAGSTKGQDC